MLRAPCPPPLAGEVAAKLTEGGTVELRHCKSPLSRVPRQLPRKQGSKPCPPPLAGEVAAKLTEGGLSSSATLSPFGARSISSASFGFKQAQLVLRAPYPPPLAGEVAAKLTEGGTVELRHCKHPLSRVPRQLPRHQGSKPCPPPLAGEVAAKLTEGGTTEVPHFKSIWSAEHQLRIFWL